MGKDIKGQVTAEGKGGGSEGRVDGHRPFFSLGNISRPTYWYRRQKNSSQVKFKRHLCDLD